MVASLASKVPVVTDVVLSITEALLGRRLLGDPRPVHLTHEPLTVDRAQLPPSTTSGFELREGEVTLEVQLDEAWWNERELANSTVTARLMLGSRLITLWLAGEDALQWRMRGLTDGEVAAVTRIVGGAPVE